MTFGRAIPPTIILLCLCSGTMAQVTYTGTNYADAFLATGSAGNPAGANLTGLNFGGAGTLVIAPASSVKGEFQSVIRFSLTNAIALFNTTFGTNNWTITNISLELTSNYGTGGVQPNNGIFPQISGGKFAIEWLSNGAWAEGTGTPNLPTTDGVTYNSLAGLLSGAHEIISTNTYSPPGDNVHVTYTLPLNTNLVNDVAGVGDVTFHFYAADGQIGYLFNSYSFGRGNQPLIHVTVTPNPVPPTILAAYFTNANFHLTGRGATNGQHQVQANSDLGTTNWLMIGPVTADATGLIQFDDTAATNHPQRFYRLSH